MPDRPVDRRGFFRQGLRELLKPLAQVIEPVERVTRQLEKLEASPAPASPPPVEPARRKYPLSIVLRPPGALEESTFLDTCSRCGKCAEVCPACCISLDSTASRGNGAPFIVAEEMPCVVCQGLLCMPACPTGALVPTLLANIDMGTAMWRQDLCVRTGGEPCTRCVDDCPLGSAAIVLDGPRVRVIEDGCVGCGVCQHSCPTEPKSIIVVPKSARR